MTRVDPAGTFSLRRAWRYLGVVDDVCDLSDCATWSKHFDIFEAECEGEYNANDDEFMRKYIGRGRNRCGRIGLFSAGQSNLRYGQLLRIDSCSGNILIAHRSDSS